MKKSGIILSLLLFVLLQAGQAQSGKLAELFDDYKDGKGYTVVDLKADIKIDSDEANAFLEGIKGIKIISMDAEDYEISQIEKFYEKARKAIDKDGFEEMMNVIDGDEKVGFYILDGKSGVSNGCALLVREKDETTLIYIEGIIDFARAMGMMGNMNFHDHQGKDFDDHDHDAED
ncbi:MAG: DUF4252 domain-containing protein [Bacteroidota bacterium]|nr:DUF4252 domain-containing protein [Bacteroidota bacterium]